MAAVACEIVGTGDGKIENLHKSSDRLTSKVIAKELVLEIVNSALDMVEESSCSREMMENEEKIRDKKCYGSDDPKEKIVVPLKGTGDQGSNEAFEQTEVCPFHPPVEKKNRLTDLVKNSKQLLAKIMMSESKVSFQQQKKEEQEEHVVDVIELDCIQIHDLPFTCRQKILPEEVPLPRNDSLEILNPPIEEASLEEDQDIGEESEVMPGKSKESLKKTSTFPRSNGAKAKAAFAAKCRTLRMSTLNLKKKKWNVGGRIVNFFKKKKDSKAAVNDPMKSDGVEDLPNKDNE
ncbi:uncharacterized protein LOC115882682 [Sitophilus oryzae]|uniref:Uncharacterized protein LOC115882682 n=1 Tax=Sitophilus oryzae TaxID=7048 RepID=A0A6J2Y1D5_SITOR|nr:uncharacterized protein LOC115882682 [Sitophilus oryzae]